MKILITGGAGYIGSITTELLSKKSKHELIVLDNLERGYQEAIDKIRCLKKSKILLVKADIRNRNSLEKIFEYYKPTAILHFSAYKSVSESNLKPSQYYENNVLGTKNLLDVSIKHNVKKLTFSSTAAIYGDSLKMPLKENSKMLPKSVYGKTKLEMENLVKRYYGNKNSSVYIFRFFNVIGASNNGFLGENPKLSTSLVPLVVQAGLGNNNYLTIFGNKFNTPDGSQLRDYISVNDIASAHLKVIDRRNHSGIHIYNLSTNTPTSCLEIISFVENALNKKINYTIGKPRTEDIVTSYASSMKIQEDIGWIPKEKIIDAIRNQIKWTKENPEGLLY